MKRRFELKVVTRQWPEPVESYFDYDQLHYHNPNPSMKLKKCPEGHYWTTARWQRCGSCEFGNEPLQVEDVTEVITG